MVVPRFELASGNSGFEGEMTNIRFEDYNRPI